MWLHVYKFLLRKLHLFILVTIWTYFIVFLSRDTQSGASYPHINMSVPIVTILPIIKEYLKTQGEWSMLIVLLYKWHNIWEESVVIVKSFWLNYMYDKSGNNVFVDQYVYLTFIQLSPDMRLSSSLLIHLCGFLSVSFCLSFNKNS